MATFSQGIEEGIHDFFIIRGRMSRSAYWWFFLFCIIVLYAFAFLVIILGGMHDRTSIQLLNILPDIVWLYLFIVPGIRRLHDINKGAENVLWLLLPIIGWIYLIYLFCKPGDPDENYYGIQPFK